MSPDGDQILPVDSPVNVTLVCNVSQDSNNSAGTQAIWEVEDRQIQSGSVRTAFANIGIFIEEEEEAVGLVSLIVSREARLQYEDSGLMVRCTAFTSGEPPITLRGNAITIRTYGESFLLFSHAVLTDYVCRAPRHTWQPSTSGL